MRVLLVIHSLMAVFLMGAVSHQIASALWVPKKKNGFIVRFSSVRPSYYPSAIALLYVATFLLGGVVYTDFRLDAKPALEDMGRMQLIGMFELKEHLAAIGLGILPAYWMFWAKVPRAAQELNRLMLTIFLGFSVWFSFLVGLVINNVKGIGS